MQMPAMQPQPQGIDAILQALALGGQPVGNMGKMPMGINQPSMPNINPAQEATIPVQGDQMRLILEALMRNGAFNQTTSVG